MPPKIPTRPGVPLRKPRAKDTVAYKAAYEAQLLQGGIRRELTFEFDEVEAMLFAFGDVDQQSLPETVKVLDEIITE